MGAIDAKTAHITHKQRHMCVCVYVWQRTSRIWHLVTHSRDRDDGGTMHSKIYTEASGRLALELYVYKHLWEHRTRAQNNSVDNDKAFF